MGVVGSPELLEKLRYMLDDSNPDVRYNAATRLAHHGDAAAVPLLAEMLDPSETAGVNQEKEEALRPLKRNLIAVNALRAAGQLAEKNRDADLTPLKQAVEKLLAGDVGGEVRIEATNTLRILNSRASR